jgi:hypothetical protein
MGTERLYPGSGSLNPPFSSSLVGCGPYLGIAETWPRTNNLRFWSTGATVPKVAVECAS